MKRSIFLLSLVALLSSCNYFPKYTKVEGSVLTITNFDCGIGITGFNQIHGDFETLDKEVFDALIGRNEIFEIKMVRDNAKDTFGNNKVISHDLGKINASDLSNYTEVSYWVSATGGTQRLIFPSNP